MANQEKIREFLWESSSPDIIASVLAPLINSFVFVACIGGFFILVTILLIGDREKIEQNQGG